MLALAAIRLLRNFKCSARPHINSSSSRPSCAACDSTIQQATQTSLQTNCTQYHTSAGSRSGQRQQQQ
jgi:hypothetical protein